MPTLRIDDHDLYYEDEGSGPAVVFVHGWGSSARVWHSVLPDLVGDHRVVSYDARGCGRSDRPAIGNTLARNAEDLVEIVTALGLERPLVVGNSIGAVFGTEAVLSAPGRFGGLVAVDGPGHWASRTADRTLGLRQQLRRDRAGTVQGWVPGWYHDETSPAVAWTVRQILDSGPYIDVLFDEVAGYDPLPSLSGIDVPTVYLHGRQDTQIPLHVAEELATATPGASLVVVDDAGHMPHQEQPAVVAEVVARAARAGQASRRSTTSPSMTG